MSACQFILGTNPETVTELLLAGSCMLVLLFSTLCLIQQTWQNTHLLWI